MRAAGAIGATNEAMVDYSKWDIVDEDDEPVAARPAASSSSYTGDRQANHDQSMALIADWVREACPHLDSDAVAQLMHFVSVQHPGIHPHNIMRHQGIVAFLEAAEANGRSPSPHAILALGHLAKERSEAADRDAAARGERVLVVAMHALNTLAACDREGGPRKLYDTMLHEPKGEVAARYKELEYATDYVRAPPADPRLDPPPSAASELTWGQKLRRALVQQLLAAVFSALVVRFFLMPDELAPALDEAVGGALGGGGASEEELPRF